MIESFYKQVVEDSPIGYAYHEIICDAQGIAVDYRFLEANPAFEKYTGLQVSQVVGKTVCEVMPGIEQDSFDWIGAYGEVALHGGSIECKQYSEYLKRWYQVKAYSKKAPYFIVQFSEIPEEASQEGDLRQLQAISNRLFATETGLLDFSMETEEARLLAKAKYSAFYLYDHATHQYVLQSISNDKTQLSPSSQCVSPESFDNFFKDTLASSQIQESGIIRNYPSASDFYDGPISQQIAKGLGIGEVVFVWIGSSKSELGYFVHLMPEKHRFTKQQILELHAEQFGLAISRGMVQRQLEKELEFTKALFESLPGYLYVYDYQGKLVRWNKTHEELTGYSFGELAGMTMENWYEGEDLQRVLAAVDQVFNTGSGQVEAPLLKKDGSKIWVRSNGVSFKNDGKEYFVGIGVDITERRQKEQALQESEYRFRRALTEAPTPVVLHSDDGKLLNINKTCTELTGFTIGDLPTIEDWAKRIFGMDEATSKKLSQKVYAIKDRKYNGCFSVNTSKGKTLSWDFYSAFLGDFPDGKKLYVSVGIDNTERNRLENELKDERNLLKTTLLSVGDGIISTDLYGNIVYINQVAETLTGWNQEAARGKPITQVFDIMNEMTGKPSEDIVKEVIVSRKVHEIANHTILKSKDGKEYPIEDSAAPIIREDGEVAGVVLVFRDFTEKKRRNEEILFLSYHDHLTGLYNRRYFDEWMDTVDCEGTVPVSIVMGDINGLKLMNDAFGYRAGDALLTKTADILKKECGRDGIAVRVGGDEFVLLLKGFCRSETELIIKRIKEKIGQSRVSNMTLSISIGYGVKEKVCQDLRKIYKQAESDMYKHKLYESLSFRSRTIGLITSALFEKSSREMSHSKRVGSLCGFIAKEMAFGEDSVSRMQIAGLMHDIGKIGVPEMILNKSESLTTTEWEKMKRHPEIGYRILLSTQEYSEVAEFILAHHERWDGRGYPRGLKGEAIPLEARIICIADSYDAMTTKRPYKDGMARAEAIKEIVSCSGTQFDPGLVEILVAVLENPDFSV
jgi:diguanylate cyclase (GGDEF)-like protein/PAS domain S-box-containing protein